MPQIEELPEAGDGDIFPLTAVQQSYRLGRAADEPMGDVACHIYFEFDGPEIDWARMASAFLELQRRHSILRAAFPDDAEDAVILSEPVARLRVLDLTADQNGSHTRQLDRLRSEMSSQKMAVDQGHTMDVRLSVLPGRRSRLHIDIDHLAADHPGIRVLLSDLADLYVGHDGDPVGDFAAYRRAGHDDEPAPDIDAWRRRLADRELAPPPLPLTADPSTCSGARFARRGIELAPERWARLTRKAEQNEVEIGAVLLAAYAHTLGRWCANPDFLINLPVFDRPGSTRMVGDFTRLIVLTFDATGPGTLRELVDVVDVVAREYRSGRSPEFASAAAALRTIARKRKEATPLLGVVYTDLIETPWTTARFEETFGSMAWTITQSPQVWLDCVCFQHGGGVRMAWDAAEELFAPQVLDSMVEYCGSVLDAFVERLWDEALPDSLPRRQREARARVNASKRVESGKLLHQR
ncbi:condensation domain-containing protein [Nocardia tenerifensis]|uniref:Condensation domain-containing protein n=1 Tax=Nocardia tenerifensis TaxID=228006 RepID=A0A318KBA2_9NOCA|nr:condensation domain-containing protein [Nocardia tenerifensis]PXX71801.1 condensation domain-containing protein [Nocardia tenerifensis]